MTEGIEMTTETVTEETVIEAPAPVKKKPALKATANKPATKKTVAKKTADQSSDLLSEKIEAIRDQLKETSDKITDTMKNVAYAQLGIYGRFYDEVSSRIEARRADIPKQWDTLVKRGEEVQKDAEERRKELQQRIKDIDLKADLQVSLEKVKDTLDKVRSYTKKAA